MARAEAFANEISVIKALAQDYSKRDDLDAVSAVQRDAEAIQQCAVQRETEVKEILKGLTRQAQEAQASSTYPHREGQHAEHVAVMSSELTAIKMSLERLDWENRLTGQQLEEVEQHLQECCKREADIAVLKAMEPTLRYQLSLFAHISKITWRLEGDRAVAGTVSDPKGRDIRHFSFDRSKATQFEITNALWGLL